MKKVLVLFVFLLLGGFIYYSVNYVDNGEIDYTKDSENYNDKIRDLKIQKEILIEELDRYDNKDINIPNMGSVILLLSDSNIEHLEDTIPILNNNDYAGVIALSSSHMPDRNEAGYLNKKDIDNLIDKGYELVIKLHGNEDVDKIYTRFVNKGYDIKGFYLPDDVISIETIKDIKAIGDMIIIGNFGDYEDDEILLVEKYGNYYSNVKNKFFDSIKESKTIAISVGYDDEDVDEEYEYVNFSSMISVINPNVDDETTDVCNVTQALERYNALLKKYDSIDADTREKIRELKNKIAKIDEQFSEYEMNNGK